MRPTASTSSPPTFSGVPIPASRFRSTGVQVGDSKPAARRPAKSEKHAGSACWLYGLMPDRRSTKPEFLPKPVEPVFLAPSFEVGSVRPRGAAGVSLLALRRYSRAFSESKSRIRIVSESAWLAHSLQCDVYDAHSSHRSYLGAQRLPICPLRAYHGASGSRGALRCSFGYRWIVRPAGLRTARSGATAPELV